MVGDMVMALFGAPVDDPARRPRGGHSGRDGAASCAKRPLGAEAGWPWASVSASIAAR
jgi:hypothetical protein